MESSRAEEQGAIVFLRLHLDGFLMASKELRSRRDAEFVGWRRKRRRISAISAEFEDPSDIRYPDEEAGEIPMAFIVRRPGSTLSSVAVMDFVAKQVAPYKKIRRVEFIDAIPKSAAGKILRRELVQRAGCSPKSKL